MASASRSTTGHYKIEFKNFDGKVKRISPETKNKKIAKAFTYRIDQLVSAKVHGVEPAREDAEWISLLSDRFREKLERAGLIRPIEKAKILSLADWIVEYKAFKTDVGEETHKTYDKAERNLLKYFGKDKLLADITEQDAHNFRAWLLAKKPKGEGLSENTTRKRCSISKQFYTGAIRAKIIKDNPFVSVPCTTRENNERMFFVKPEIAERVLAACPTTEWKLIFALSRYAGLRCPSEVLPLKWSDIDWKDQRIRIFAKKTKRVNGGVRIIPLFKELAPILRAAKAEYSHTSEFCIPTYQGSTNLSTSLKKFVKKAGLTPWPKIFQNMRSTRETELIKKCGLKAACAWIGNSPQVALKHYAQIMDEDFDAVVEKFGIGDAISDVTVTQNSALNTDEQICKDSQVLKGRPFPVNVYAAICESMHKKTDSCEKHESVMNGPYWTRNKIFKHSNYSNLYQIAFLSDAIKFEI